MQTATATMLQHFIPAYLLIVLLALSGCNSTEENTAAADKKVKPPPTETALYRAARKKMVGRHYSDAAKLFQELELLYPFSRYAERAKLEIIYAHYKAYELDEARTAADDFLRLHTDHPNADYAQYLKALSKFSENRRPFEMTLKGALSHRDLTPIKESFDDFKELLEGFPDSKYLPDARQRMVFIRNILAAQEVLIGEYYLKRNAFVAAVNRGRYVVENYSQTPAIESALELLIAAYTNIERIDLAKETIAVLKLNYPKNSNFMPNGSYQVPAVPKAGARSILNVVTFGLLSRPPVLPARILSLSDEEES